MAEEDTHNEKEKDEVEIVEDDGDARAKIELLKRQLKECQAAKDEYLGGWQRAKADYVNMTRQLVEREGRVRVHVQEQVLREFLEVLDQFDRAFSEQKPDSTPWATGIQHIADNFRKILIRQGVEAFGLPDEIFDPQYYEAVDVIHVDTEVDDGKIIEVLLRGYKIGDRILRPAKVKVARFHK